MIRIKGTTREEVRKTIRKSWGNLSPVQRVRDGKKAYRRKPKHREW